jgi:uncharacterized protein YaaQ
MKLMIVILRDIDGEDVIYQLIQNGYRVTRMASTGGFFRRGNVTLLIGVDADKVEAVFDLLRATCKPGEANYHRATVFVVNMPLFEQI